MDTTQPDSFSKVKVYSLLGLGITAIGFSPILVKIVTNESAFLVASVRTVFAFLLLIPVYFSARNKDDKREISTKEHIWVAISGILLGLHLICWIASIYFTSIASASVLVTTHPIILIIIERFVFKYKFRLIVWLGVFISFFGSIILGYSDFGNEGIYPNPLLGNLLAFGASAIFAVYFIIGNRVRQKRNWIEYVFPVYGYAALTCVVTLFVVEGFSFELSGLLLLVGFGLAVGPQIAGHGALNYAVKFVSPTLIATLILFEPAASSVMAFFFFGEVPLPLSFVGMAIILLGITFTWSKKKGV
ncbi:MAG: DMT family transporter [Balneolaceae bacterium]|nr:DMT family transporter [Balneolaceae bacterium]MBO6545281.1 DMT family transporter [Balneolaceae bacterium]MBO6646677.1 DMT family transporter [Balneolaceae bacterium]